MKRNGMRETVQAGEDRQARAFELFVAGRTTAEVAAALGVDHSTAWRWRTSPRFVAALAAVRRDRLEKLRSRIDELAGEAIDVLAEVMRDGGTSAAVRIRAAAALLGRIGDPDGLEQAAEAPSNNDELMYAMSRATP